MLVDAEVADAVVLVLLDVLAFSNAARSVCSCASSDCSSLANWSTGLVDVLSLLELVVVLVEVEALVLLVLVLLALVLLALVLLESLEDVPSAV
ncbi:hypothetical protein GCM10011611_37610 [Aliidongia dinghuensis]|uniref:Uncharacterized protein n=1 Tax=Aliidongia dinghuensis TaxID=1867774 RepID=A0A8J3E4L3_9PROT|nr:hypothetical protein GCM10011611_37610 [Aliidongia dinghuensis]